MIAGRGRPLCVRAHLASSTDGGRNSHGRGWWDRLRRPSARPCASDLAFRILLDVVVSLVAGFGLGLGVLGAEGVGDPLVRGVSLPVDAVGVDLQQDRDAVPGASANGISDLRLPVQSTYQ